MKIPGTMSKTIEQKRGQTTSNTRAKTIAKNLGCLPQNNNVVAQ